jgi:hypothetical protein
MYLMVLRTADYRKNFSCWCSGMKKFEDIFKKGEPARDKFLSRLFGIFSEQVVRIWAGQPHSKYADIGRPTLYSQPGKKGCTLDFTMRRRSDGKLFVAEMKCELEYNSYAYLRLTDPRQLDHHQSEAFRDFLGISRDPRSMPVRVQGSPVKVDGGILVWGAVSEEGRIATQDAYRFADILSVEEIIGELQNMYSPEWSQMVAMYRMWTNDLFDALERTH